MEKALTLKEAAALLGVSYSTVYTHKEDLGFFQIGNQWRVWPETLRQNLEKRSEEKTPKPVAATPGPQVGVPARSRQRMPPARAAELAAVDRELDELLARKPPKRRS
ncbi:helix-turn-helix domain-containing protein [Paraburkholderia phenazinium]|uniref:DNA binding domain-containing protein, excisionase family n=1 Tax=Paraburkholderia phenazinium TaxID=60549 RepID=A0A1G8FKX3_9BURK|nr:helix-turn-helix domain-containing protein [Paraburkholderia phenazinium]SDH82810.1 DNA binding domain-containing protein, excisionase family [Paraburkholderia phenazinium]